MSGKKSNIVKLSKDVTAYKLLKDGNDSLVIRTTSGIGNGLFGVNGPDELNVLYYGTLSLLKANEEEIKSISKFGQEEKLIDILEEGDLKKMNEVAVSVSNNKDELRIGRICLRFHLGKAAQISLFRYDVTETFAQTGIYLFTSTIVKLVKYISTIFGVGETPFSFIDFKNDDFLDM